MIVFLGVKTSGREDKETDFVRFNSMEVEYIRMTKPTKHSSYLPTYYTPHGSYFSLRTLDDVESALKPHGFFRYDHSTIVNRNNLKRIYSTKHDTIIEFNSGISVSVSKKTTRL